MVRFPLSLSLPKAASIRAPVALVVGLLCAAPVAAAPTALLLHPSEIGVPYEVEYSQAVSVQVLLGTTAGVPIVGERVNLKLRRGDDTDTEFLFADPVTDAMGVATGRLTLVNGRYGGQTFVAADQTVDLAGERYVITASFLGDGGALGCDAGDAGPAADAGADATLCDAETSLELFLQPEVATLVIAPGNEVQLGETLRLFATLTDENGDAPEAGTAVDGDTSRPLAGRTMSFFYDLDGNGSPALNERLRCENTEAFETTTNGQGVAACDFFTDPSFVDTINVDNGIHAQFGGDDQYTVAGASQALIVSPGVPEATRTILSVTPEVVPADGFSLVTIDATLVDAVNNVLTVDDPGYDVTFLTDMGTLEDVAERDPITGHYLQELKAPREGGRATIQVVIEGVPGADVRVEFEQRGCSCDSATPRPAAYGLITALLLAMSGLRARRRR